MANRNRETTMCNIHFMRNCHLCPPLPPEPIEADLQRIEPAASAEADRPRIDPFASAVTRRGLYGNPFFDTPSSFDSSPRPSAQPRGNPFWPAVDDFGDGDVIIIDEPIERAARQREAERASSPSRAEPSRVSDCEGASGKGPSVRRGLESLIRATKKKLSLRSRRTNTSSRGEETDEAPVESEASAAKPSTRVPAIIPITSSNFTDGSLATWMENSGPGMRAHTTVDYRHYLLPGLIQVTNCAFYWGHMDRYKAESLLENKPEGTFLLRDSSQDDFIFSVSFRRYGRSLHARVEQWNHQFSFDAHDSSVFKADSVTALIEHYKDPQACMFFEPMLTHPLPRKQPFSLLHLTRAVVCDNISYDHIERMLLPKQLRHYLKYYYYKQPIRVRTESSWVDMHSNENF